MSDDSNEVDPLREVRRLHLMLEDWYGGIRDDIDFIADALAEEFTWIAPDGTIAERTDALAAWSDRRSSYVDSRPPVSVEIEDETIRRSIYGVHQLTYLKRIRVDGEWQEFACSLWLRETEQVRTGLQWLHLTEAPVVDDSDED